MFEHTKGVISAASGYHGGTKRSATYKLVSAGLTNHAEVVRVVYDPSVVSYGQLMQVFFSVVADPTTLNAQGPDRGKHYRSALIPTNSAQAQSRPRLSDAAWQRQILEKADCDQDRGL